MPESWSRNRVLPEGPFDGRGALERGRYLARTVRVGPCPYLTQRGIVSELEDKRRAIAERRFTFHAQIGYRHLDESRRAYSEIFERLAPDGAAPDRYGICLDWSMGYPAAERAGRPRGTGLILERPEDFATLTAMAPVAPHFGDFVLGMPAAAENTAAALAAGATTIGNLSQYFTFRLPGFADDVETTRATVEALGLLCAQPVEILVHSNLDDGYAAWFEDMSSALGFALVERWIVEELIGLPLGHCFGHTYSDPRKRLAFQIALARVSSTPGTMLYGNTTLYGPEPAANYGALASYLTVDLLALSRLPSGHAVTPIPTSEALRIPTIGEVADAHRAGRRLAERIPELLPLFSPGPAEDLADCLVRRGQRFRDRLLDGLEAAGFDLSDPLEILLALRRIGPRSLEARFGDADADDLPVTSSFVDEIDTLASHVLAATSLADRRAVAARRPRVIVATTDVHFYGKRLLEIVLGRLGAEVIDGGVSVDPDLLAERTAAERAEFIALSTYNGVALSFVRRLRRELARCNIAPKVFVGGRLNEIMEDTGSLLPVEVHDELRQVGVVPCSGVQDLLSALARQELTTARPPP